MRRVLTIFLSMLFYLSVSNSYQAQAEEKIFIDITENHWAYHTIKWGIENKVISGYSDGSFLPNKNVTQSEFIAMLMNTYINKTKITIDPNIIAANNDFLNVWKQSESNKDSAWDARYTTTSYKLKWQTNPSGNNSDITRGEVAKILSSAMGFYCYEDQSIQLLLDNKLSNGKSSRTIDGFDKTGYLTRSEAIQFIYNFQDQVTALKPKPQDTSKGCPSPQYKEEEISPKQQDPVKSVEPTPETERRSAAISGEMYNSLIKQNTLKLGINEETVLELLGSPNTKVKDYPNIGWETWSYQVNIKAGLYEPRIMTTFHLISFNTEGIAVFISNINR